MKTLEVALKSNQFHIIEWGLSLGLNFYSSKYIVHKTNGIPSSAFNQYFRQGDYLQICKEVVEFGYLDLLQAFWDEFHLPMSTAIPTAIEFGHFHIAKWLFATHSQLSSACMNMAARKGHCNILEWLMDQKCPMVNEDVLLACLENKSTALSAMRCVLSRGCVMTDRVALQVSRHGNIELMKLCFEHGVVYDREMSAMASSGGHLKLLKWFHKEGYPMPNNVIYLSCIGGHIHILNWLKNHLKSSQSEGLLYCATNNIFVVKWALKHGIDWKPFPWFCIRQCVMWNDVELFEWFAKQDMKRHEILHVADIAARNGGLIHFIKPQLYRFPNLMFSNLLVEACRLGNVFFFNWLILHGVRCSELNQKECLNWIKRCHNNHFRSIATYVIRQQTSVVDHVLKKSDS